MKKSLFAVAATTAFTGAAQAQSSVTVYGLLDVGYTNGDARASSGTTNAKQNISRISNSMESGSRIGFRGNEDLGGGTSAQFVFELGIQPAGNGGSNADGSTSAPAATTAASQSSSSNASAPNWTPNIRQAFVGITQKGLGTARVGTQNTLYWEQAGSNTAGQLSQTAGSMLAPTIDGAFFNTTTLNGTTNTIVNGAAFGAYSTRTTNTINFRTERMSGAMLKASWTQSNQNTSQTTPANTISASNSFAGGTSNQQGYQAALDWNIQKANIQASYAAFKSENPNGAVTVTASCAAVGCTALGIGATAGGTTAWGGGVMGNNVNDTQALITASYDFGILKAYAGWAQRKVSNTYNSTQYLQRTAQEIGVRGYVTKSIEGWASVGNGRYTTWQNTGVTANITGYQVGSNYWMSKRTNFYAIYGQNGTSSTSNGSANVGQASVGVRHTF
jgi:hypothetical protein